MKSEEVNLIDFSKISNYTSEFNRRKDLCSLFKLLAVETWKRLEFIYIKPYIKLYETTVTQNIAFTIDKYKDYYNLPIKIYESTNEKANGNDLELIINFRYFGTSFYAPIQAKKLFRNKKYNSIRHEGQIEKLIEYGEGNKGYKGYPLYLLYNYQDKVRTTSTSDIELLGCSILDAYTIRSKFCIKNTISSSPKYHWKKIPTFEDLLTAGTFPWHHLVCPKEPLELAKILFPVETDKFLKGKRPAFINTLDPFDLNKGFYLDLPGMNNIDQISFEGWILSTSKERIMDIPDITASIENENNDSNAEYEFKPQTRLVIDI